MTSLRCFPALALGLLVLGCAQASQPSSEQLEQARAAIRQADLDFAVAVRDHDIAAFREFVAENGRFYGARVNVGPDQVSEAWRVFLDPESETALKWAPDEAFVAASGDLGYSFGTYELVNPADDGATSSQFGNYVTIWRRGEDGRWRAVVDIGTPPGTLDGPGPALGGEG